MERRPAVIIINAVKGDVRAARGVVSRALHAALPGFRLRKEPYVAVYWSKSELPDLGPDPDPRYTLDVTDEEMARVEQALIQEARDSGFDKPPVDIYHD